jgi:hypothetical protein
MITQEKELAAKLFDRLAKPEITPARYLEAERLIAHGTAQTPHAAETPDDLKTDDDSYYADDDTWIE